MDSSDFKISRTTDNGITTEVLVRFYEGDVVEEKEETADGPKLVTRYRRRAMVGEKVMSLEAAQEMTTIREEAEKELVRVSALPRPITEVLVKDDPDAKP